MRSSSKIMGIALLAILGLSVVGLVGFRVSISRIIDGEKSGVTRLSSETSGDYVDKEYPIQGFRGIDINGAWEIELRQGASYSVEISYPEKWEEALIVGKRNERLLLDVETGYEFPGRPFKALVTMPGLERVYAAGGFKLEFSGFNESNMAIELAGAGRISGYDSVFGSARLILAGAGELDLWECQVENADVALSGAGRVALTMTGGELSGRLSGLGSIEYRGPISRDSVKISGLGSVERR